MNDMLNLDTDEAYTNKKILDEIADGLSNWRKKRLEAEIERQFYILMDLRNKYTTNRYREFAEEIENPHATPRKL